MAIRSGLQMTPASRRAEIHDDHRPCDSQPAAFTDGPFPLVVVVDSHSSSKYDLHHRGTARTNSDSERRRLHGPSGVERNDGPRPLFMDDPALLRNSAAHRP